MSGLVEKVKEKVRTRSRSRKSASRNELRTSEDLNRSSLTQTRSSHEIQDGHLGQRSPTTPSWHVYKGSRRSVDEPQSHSNHTRTDANGYTITAQSPQTARFADVSPADSIPTRTSSQRPISRDMSDTPIRPSSNYNGGVANSSAGQVNIPTRVDSLPQRKPLNGDENGYNEKRLSQQFNNLSIGSNGTRNTARTGGSEQSRALDNTMVPPPLEPRRQNPTSPRSQKKSFAPQLSEHLRLPANFDLSNTERTIVDTAWMPAVTHETVYHDKTEIVQEAISRDIHVHHYYTYVQPIKVVEVLPAKHYRLDEKTGQKIEIEAPAGWQLPAVMHPHTPDATMLKGATRHYLVNEEHPHGIIEPPPHENDERFGPVGSHAQVQQIIR